MLLSRSLTIYLKIVILDCKSINYRIIKYFNTSNLYLVNNTKQ